MAEAADLEGGRSLGLSGAVNARDLGGYPVADGRRVRAGRALRGDSLHRATDGDVELLAALGVRTVVDLRGLNEVQENGEDRVPADAVLVRQPVYSPDHDIYIELRDALAGADPAVQHALLGNGAAERIMVEMYRWFVTEPAIRAHFAGTVRQFADPDAGPVYFHCTAGKDRTGWTAAILLTALGADRDTVYADYLLTNERAGALHARILDMLGTRGMMREPELMLPILRVERSYLDASFAAVSEGWPSFDAFLSDGLGLDAETLSALRKNLLAP